MVKENLTKRLTPQDYPYQLVLDQRLPISKPMNATRTPNPIVIER